MMTMVKINVTSNMSVRGAKRNVEKGGLRLRESKGLEMKELRGVEA